MNQIVIIVVFLISLDINAQILCKKDFHQSISDYLYKGYEDMEMIGHTCGLFIEDKFSNIYIIKEQTDLIYYEKLSKTDTMTVIESGYYRLVLIDIDEQTRALCWLKDLVWNIYDIDKVVLRTIFYLKGNIVRTLYERKD